MHSILVDNTSSDETEKMCMLARVLSSRLSGNSHTFMHRLNNDVVMIFLEIKDTRHTKIKSFIIKTCAGEALCISIIASVRGKICKYGVPTGSKVDFTLTSKLI